MNKRGKLIIFVLVLFVTLALSITFISANTNENFEYRINDDSVIITKYIGNDTDVVIQTTDSEGLEFVSNGDGTCYVSGIGSCNDTNVVIPPKSPDGDSVTRIDVTFGGCSNLISIEIPNSVTSIGECAFSECSNLTSISIPNSVTSIEEYAFSGCVKLASITLPNSLISLGEGAFNECISLTSIVIPDSVTSIKEYTFSGCVKLESITLPNSLISIGEWAFNGCISLTSIVIPDNVTSIDKNAFLGCVKLTSITLPNSLISIGEGAFSGCENLKNVYYTGTAEQWAKITIGLNNSSLTNATITFNSQPTLPTTDSEGLEFVSNGDGTCYVSGIGSCIDTDIVIPSKSPNGDSVINIGAYAFAECRSLTSIKIPNSVTSIGKRAFDKCSSLKNVNYNGTAEQWAKIIIESDNDPLINAKITFNDQPTIPTTYSEGLEFISYGDGTCYLNGIGTCTDLDIVIPPKSPDGDVVIHIGQNAFNNCSSLTSIEIPNSVTYISDYAFARCTGLTNIEIPESVTHIERFALYECNNLTSITIPFVGGGRDGTNYFGYIFGASSISYNQSFVPKSLETVIILGGNSIEAYAFSYCDNIVSIEIPDSVTYLGNGAFSYCSSLTNIEIPTNVTYLSERLFYFCVNLKNITIPDGTIRIDKEAFCGCSLTNIEIPDSVSTIGRGAFAYCPLTTITIELYGGYLGYIFGANDYSNAYRFIPDTLKSVVIKPQKNTDNCVIDNNAFYKCGGLTSIEIPDSITSIGSNAFGGCSSLTSIEIPNSVTSIGSNAFGECISLTSIVIPDSVTSIEEYTFSGCVKLESITLPNSLTTIGEGAFSGCENLKNVYYTGTAEQWAKIIIESDNDPLINAKITFNDQPTLPTTDSEGLEFVSNGDGTCYVSGIGSCTDTDIVIPSKSPNGDSVINIGAYAFDECSSLTSIKIPNSVTSIGDYVFSGCSSLKNIEIPNSVTNIGDSAFSYCDSLTSIKIPTSVISIGTSAFSDCDNIKIVYIDSLESWLQIEFSEGGNPCKQGSVIYLNNEPLTKVIVPDTISKINDYAFYLSNITELVVPGNVKSIGKQAFSYSKNLKKVIINEGVQIIDEFAFNNCNNLSSIKLPKQMSKIGLGAFSYTNIESIEIPYGIEIIDELVFCWCENLKKIYLPETIKVIKGNSFDYCSIEELHITDLEAWCNVTVGVVEGLTDLYVDDVKVENLVIPSTITEIKDNIFASFSSIKSVILHDKVKLIGKRAFAKCTNLVSINLPYGITKLGEMAFSGCSSLKTIDIPNSCIKIGNAAFLDCASLTQIELPNKLKTIEGYLFQNCTELETVVIPKTVTTIENNAFCGCEKLNNIELPNNLISIGSMAFYDCFNLNVLKLGSSLKEIGSNCFYGCKSLTEITIPSSVEKMGECILGECESLKEITLPFVDKLVFDIDDLKYQRPLGYVFGTTYYNNCVSVIQEYFDASFGRTVTRYYKFPSDLKKITITGGYISKNVFRNLSMIDNLVLGDDVQYVEYSSLNGLSGLENLTLPFVGIIKNDETNYNYQMPVGCVFGVDYYDNSISIMQSYLSENNEEIHETYYIPSSLKKLTILGGNIMQRGMKNFVTIDNLVLGIDVEFIQSGALSGMSNLKELTIPYVGPTHFEDNDTRFYVPFGFIFGHEFYDNSTLVSQHMEYKNTTSFENYYIPNNLKSVTILECSIPKYAFENCNMIEKVVIDENVERIERSAFYNCSNLKTLSMSYGIKTIDSEAFSGCYQLETIDIPGSVGYIGLYAFNEPNGVGHIKRINIDSIESFCKIEKTFGVNNTSPLPLDNAGLYLDGVLVESIIIPETITTITRCTFENYQYLKEIVFSSKLENIEEYAFSKCYNLEKISLENSSLKTLGNRAFFECTNLSNFIIPEGVTTVGDYAFYGCKNLTTITVPSSVTKLPNNAFQYCYLSEIVNNSKINITINADMAFAYVNNGGVKSYLNDGNSYIETQDGFLFTKKNNKYSLVYYFGTEDTVTLPSDINGNVYELNKVRGVKNVIVPGTFGKINGYAFGDQLTSVTVLDGVTLIDDYAFYQCENLNSIILPSSITKIGNYAFKSCRNLRDFVVPASVTTIGNYAFNGCTQLSSIYIPKTVSQIPNNAFHDCPNLVNIIVDEDNKNYLVRQNILYDLNTKTLLLASKDCTNVEIMEGISYIGDYAFNNCNNLTSIEIPDGIINIREHAFFGCQNLTTIKIPDSVTYIGKNAFFKCDNLDKVHIDSIECWCNMNFVDVYSNPLYAGANLYLNNQILLDITIPNTINEIKKYAFCGYEDLTSIKIPNSVTSILGSAFYNCNNIESVYIDSLESWCNISFADTNSNPLSKGAKLYLNDKILLEIVIPNTITEIKKYAFYGCESLTNIKIPNSVTNIGYYAFSYCDNLKYVEIPEGVQIIDSGSFYQCEKLIYVKIPNSLKSIGSDAFRECKKLFFIKNDSNLNLKLGNTQNGYISYYAKVIENYDESILSLQTGVTYLLKDEFVFEKNNDKYFLVGYLGKEDIITLPQNINGETYDIKELCFVKGVILPNNITSISEKAFSGNKDLVSVKIPNSVTSIGNNAFENCINLTSVELPNNLTSIGNGAFYNCKSLTNIIIPNSVTNIENSAFYMCNSLTSINIPNNVTSLGHRTFYGCYNLKNIILPDNLLEIGVSTFEGCKSLSNIILPNSLTKIDSYAFKDCYSIVSIDIPDTVLYIGKGCFTNCYNLFEVFLPSNYNNINSNTFDSCLSLMTITIPENCYGITENAFFNNTNLRSIFITNNIEFGTLSFGCCFNLKKVNLNDVNTWLLCSFVAENSNPLSTGAGLYVNNELVKDVVVDGVSTLKKYTFNNYNYLNSIYIGKDVQIIEKSAFWGCDNLVSIVVDEENERYDSRNNCNAIITKKSFSYNLTDFAYASYSGNTLIVGCNKTIIPDDIKTISGYAFRNNSKLNSIEIPASVTLIESYAFNNYNLQKIIANGINCKFYNNPIMCGKITIYGYAGSSYQSLANSNIKFELISDTSISTDDENIVLKGNNYVLDNIQVVCNEVNDIDEAIIVDYGGEKYTAFDISINNGDETVQPQESISVCIKVPNGFIGGRCKVYYRDEYGNLTDMEAKFDDGYIVFETNHFSEYIIMELDHLAGDINDNGIIDNHDLFALFKYLSNIETSLNNKALDINKDNKVNNKDITRLFQYLSKYNVVIY